MRHRKPVNVRTFSMLHNMIMFWASLYMVIETVRQVRSLFRSLSPSSVYCSTKVILAAHIHSIIKFQFSKLQPQANPHALFHHGSTPPLRNRFKSKLASTICSIQPGTGKPPRDVKHGLPMLVCRPVTTLAGGGLEGEESGEMWRRPQANPSAPRDSGWRMCCGSTTCPRQLAECVQHIARSSVFAAEKCLFEMSKPV